MPEYSFRCATCGEDVTLFYKSYRAYDEAGAAGRTCPHCGASTLTPTITRVSIAKGGTNGHNYAGMSSGEMLNVLESGKSAEVEMLFKQVQDTAT